MMARVFFLMLVVTLFFGFFGAYAAELEAENEAVAQGVAKDAAKPDPIFEKFENQELGGGATGERNTDGNEDVSPWGVVARIFGSLVLLIMVIIAGAIVFKRFVLGAKGGFSSKSAEVLSRTHIDNRRYVALLRVGRKVLVVGVYPDGMSALGEIEDPEEVAEIMQQARPASEAGKGVFLDLLQGGLKKENATDVSEVPGGESTELTREMESIRSRLRGLRRES